jgi:hypothetical protein
MGNSNIPEDTMVVTSTYITEEKMPILIVTHEDDEEGGSLWQFHCGNGDYDMSKMKLVRLDTILSIDPGVRAVLNLPMGLTAIRSSRAAVWTYEGL